MGERLETHTTVGPSKQGKVSLVKLFLDVMDFGGRHSGVSHNKVI